MADATHLEKLLEGVEAWNEWRKANPDTMPDLTDADLTKDALRRTALYECDGNGNSKVNLQRADLRRANLQGAILLGANLQSADLSNANLKDAQLSYANLQDAQVEDAKFRRADLRFVNLERAFGWQVDFGLSNLWSANLATTDFRGANFYGAKLGYANLCGAKLNAANFKTAQLDGTDLRGAQLLHANLSFSNLVGANLECTNVTGIEFDYDSRQRNYQGIRVSTCYGSQIFKTFAQDQDYIEELRASGRWGRMKFWVWWLLADCGRSLMRWALWSLGLAVLFGIVFYGMGAAHIKPDPPLPFSLITMFYYSVVTFTTLGFGDVKPQTELAAITVMLEVISGYVMLGGLVSILANKLARRA